MTLETLQDILKDKKFWFFVIILIVIAVLGIISFLPTQPTKTPFATGIEPEIRPTRPEVAVLRVEPLPDQKDVSTSPTIKISFEKSIRISDIKITSKPVADFTKTLSSGGYYLTLKPKKSLKTSTKYTLNVTVKKINVYQWSFTTSNKSGNIQAIKKIKSKLPYVGGHFRVSYASSTDKFFVTIDAKPVDKYEKAALSWFASQGLSNAEEAINIVIYPVGKAAN